MAGRPRLPQEVAKLTGATIKNAGRFNGRATLKTKSLGPPPKSFCNNKAEMWEDFNADFPWLGRSDRWLVGIACDLQAKINDDDVVPIAVYAQMRLVLSSMGGTPVDRSKVSSPDEKNESPEDEFLN